HFRRAHRALHPQGGDRRVLPRPAGDGPVGPGRAGAGGLAFGDRGPTRQDDGRADRIGVGGMNDKAALEALLFAAEATIAAGELAEVLALPAARVNELLEEMRSDLEQREAGVVLREVAGGWRLYSHPDAYQYLERFSASATARKLSSAALET